MPSCLLGLNYLFRAESPAVIRHNYNGRDCIAPVATRRPDTGKVRWVNPVWVTKNRGSLLWGMTGGEREHSLAVTQHMQPYYQLKTLRACYGARKGDFGYSGGRLG